MAGSSSVNSGIMSSNVSQDCDETVVIDVTGVRLVNWRAMVVVVVVDVVDSVDIVEPDEVSVVIDTVVDEDSAQDDVPLLGNRSLLLVSDEEIFMAVWLSYSCVS